MEVNTKFKGLIPPLTSEEYHLLEQSILQDGVRDALVVWNNTLVDGHNRYEIAKKHGIESSLKFIHKDFTDEDDATIWIVHNQLGRRNLPPFVRIELVEFLEPLLKKTAKVNSLANLKQNARNTEVKKSSPRGKTRDAIAMEAGVSHDTYRKAKELKKKAPPEVLQQLRNGSKKINTAYRELTVPKKEEEQDTACMLVSSASELIYESVKLEFKLSIDLEGFKDFVVMNHCTCLAGRDKCKDITASTVASIVQALMHVEQKVLSWQGYASYEDYYREIEDESYEQ